MDKTELKNIINYVWDKHRIDPSFLEKDIYITEILKTLSNLETDKITPIFSGGTSLHKGHKIIKRFSEDVDFRVKTKTEKTRNDRREYREYIIQEINKIPNVKVIEETIQSRNESNFFGFYIDYPKEYSLDKSLRSNIKFEMGFEKLNLETKCCQIESMVDSLDNKDNNKSDKFNIDCISLEEIAGNKLSALMWRVQIKDRTQPFGIRNDPTIMRHLHDLSALHSQIQTDNFVNMLQKSFNNDLGRSGSSKDIDLITSLNDTFDSLTNDKMYKKEYESFVNNMCYGKDNEIINFNTALNDFKEIKEFAIERINTLENSISNKDLDFDMDL